MAPIALITGATGQDGSYLAELLLSKGYEVHALYRRASNPNLTNVAHLGDALHAVDGDLTDQTSLDRAVRSVKPDEVYNLAAQSHVGTSFNQPDLTANVTGLGVLRLLEAVRGNAPGARLYQAGSSEMFGGRTDALQNESTPFYPRSPYGAAKAFAHHLVVNYRESYGLHASNGILFNHESPRRPTMFVTRRITDGVARIALGMAKTVSLGDTRPFRDWGYAPEYVELMWRILQQDKPGDYVGATGETHTVADFLREACAVAGLPGEAHEYLVVDRSRFRPAEVPRLYGDPLKAKAVLGWEARTRFRALVRIMVETDLDRLRSVK